MNKIKIVYKDGTEKVIDFLDDVSLKISFTDTPERNVNMIRIERYLDENSQERSFMMNVYKQIDAENIEDITPTIKNVEMDTLKADKFGKEYGVSATNVGNVQERVEIVIEDIDKGE